MFGDIFEVIVHCATTDQVGLNVRHYQEDNTVGAGVTVPEMATAFEIVFAPEYVSLISNAATFLGVTVQKLLPLPIGNRFGSSLLAQAGAAGANQLPKQAAGLITLRAEIGGPRGRGRAYIPFPTEEDNASDAVPSAGYAIRLALLAVKFRTRQFLVGVGGSAGFTPCILHRDFGTFSPIITATARGRWATQRRRGDFGRTNLGVTF